MTGGAGLPIDTDTDLVAALRRIENDCRQPLEDSAVIALSIVRACLAAGAADRIAYAAPQRTAGKPLRDPRRSAFKRRRR